MAVLRCKMCDGDLDYQENATVMQCKFCRTWQTVPKVNEEEIQLLFNRANVLLRKCEFDKAEQVYERILEQNDREPEAHWGMILCKYGIEYVKDPATGEHIPTCHRTSYDSIVADEDYKLALEYSDYASRQIYEKDAKAIDAIQKDILAISAKEEPFDIFICYKETDENGQRTRDSAIANDIYYQLTQEGFKVFYAAITLEDKLGKDYEPIIFAALNSAKVMLAVGTKPEHFNAVWVKNEWSRFFKMMKNDRSKLLIPCYLGKGNYDGMDAYEILPPEFAHLQSQDMSKIGFINDLIRGIKKVITPREHTAPARPAAPQVSEKPSYSPLSSSSRYDVRLISFGNRKLDCIKVVRETLGLGLKEAKDLVESPVAFLGKNLPMYEAENLKNIFARNGFEALIEEAGSTPSYSPPPSYSRPTPPPPPPVINVTCPICKNTVNNTLVNGKCRCGRCGSNFDFNQPVYISNPDTGSKHTDYTSKKRANLEKEKNNKLVLGIVFLFVFWPVAIYFFYKTYQISQEISKL